MAKPTSVIKRLLVGRPFRSDRLRHPLLPKRIAMPILASDPLSSVAYAPAEILLTLSLAGAAGYAYAPWVAVAVVLVLVTVVASYRQNVHAYPSGGGDYEVVSTNLGRTPGVVVASALLFDYVLTVAVSVSASVDNLGSAIPYVEQHRLAFAVGIVALLAAINLRGIREAGIAFALPTYLFLAGIFILLGLGLFRLFVLGDELRAPSADLVVRPENTFTGLAVAFLLVRAFASGSAALTGVEAISTGVPAFRPPKSRNAAAALLILGALSTALMLGIVGLARLTNVQYVHDPARQIVGAGPGYVQPTVTAQVADAVFGTFRGGYFFVLAVTALILVVAANTAYTGFPVLAAILAQDRYLPRQLHTRGDRLAFSNGIILLALFAIILIAAFRAETTALIQIYIVGVFLSFTLSQVGMVRHWNRMLRATRGEPARRRMRRARVVNAAGAAMTGLVLFLVLVTKFTRGAWISLVAVGCIFLLMRGIRHYYETVATELDPGDDQPVLPARNHAIVLVSRVHRPTLRAIAFAKATRPDTLTALTVNTDEEDCRRVQQEWRRREIDVPLTVVESPFREITGPIIEYLRSLRVGSPRDVVTIYIPEYVVGRWWENLLHNQSALRLKRRLLFEPGVMVTSVPWQLASSGEKDLARMDQARRQRVLRGPRPRRNPQALPPPDQDAAPAG